MTTAATTHADGTTSLRLRHLGIDTYQEPVIYMSADCPVCRSEGWDAETRLRVALDDRHIIATLNVLTGTLLAVDEASLSEVAWRSLGCREGDLLTVASPSPLLSFSHVRSKVYGGRLLVDDIISTARTMLATIGHLKRAALGAPLCIGVHAVFADGAYEELLSQGAARVVTCNTIRHPSNAIDLGGLIGTAVRAALGGE